jgi:hypothetical protein|tara:strand:- start:2603 stop:3685 length:1083 start_codon:yes stop_codon:yes gene_type:complete
MKFRTLLNKTQGEGKYIFAQPSMVFRNKEQMTGIRLHVVREDEVTRPDLIALEYYGDQTKTDLILKWNGISDPFGLVPGDILQIPPSGVSFNKLERPIATEENKIKNQFLQSKRFTSKDQRRIDALKKKYNKEYLLPPNVIPLGQKNYKFDKDGNIIFGAQAQNGEVNASSNTNSGFGDGSGGEGAGACSLGPQYTTRAECIAAGGKWTTGDNVVDEIFDEFGQSVRDALLAAQAAGNGSNSNGNGDGSGGSGNGSGGNGSGSNGDGSGGSGNGSGGNGSGQTENQLENNLNNGVGKGGETTSSGKGAGNGNGNGDGKGNGNGNGDGTNSSSTGTNSNSSSSPSGSSNADGVANDGAPCN